MSTSPIRLEMLDFKEVLSSLPLQTLSPGAEAAFPGLPVAHGDRAIPKMSGNRKPWKMRGQLPPGVAGIRFAREHIHRAQLINTIAAGIRKRGKATATDRTPARSFLSGGSGREPF